MTHPTDEELDALVELSEKFVTATWHLLDNSETSGPIDDPTIAVWQPDFDEVSALLDRCEGLPSGSTEHMNAGELLSANMTAAITALRAQLAKVIAQNDRLWVANESLVKQLAEADASADRAEAALAAQIEADARIVEALYRNALGESDADLESPWKSHKASAFGIAVGAIRNQPHSRAALSRLLADVETKALRKAAEVCDKNENVSGWVSRDAILALIPKDDEK